MEQPSRRLGRSSLISVIVPVFNEEASVALFHKELCPHLEDTNHAFEIVLVNDGSRDATMQRLIEIKQNDDRVRIINLSRNFGKEAAMTAGLDFAKGDAVIIMDVDLEEPPELISDMIELWSQGYDVVVGRRVSRLEDTRLKRLTSGGFYRWFNKISDLKIPDDVGDFRLLDRAVVTSLQQMPERVRFMKGIFAWVGYRTATLDFERRSRRHGTTKFTFWRLWNFAIDGITSFSTLPLRIWSYAGGVIAIVAFLYAAFIITRTVLFGIDLPGYASLITVVLFLGGVQLIGLGVIGEYLGRVYIETKRRPIYFATEFHGRDLEVRNDFKAQAMRTD